MSDHRSHRIGVIGAGECSAEISRLAEEVGKNIAKKGGVLICGGLGGVMEASAKGAQEAGGVTVGIVPGTMGHGANAYIDIPIVTGMGEARNVIVVLSSEAVIAISGGFGTLGELAFCLKLGVPVIGLGTWKVDPRIHHATRADEAVEIAFRLMVDTSFR